MSRLVECVPNFSEGRDRAVIDAIANAVSGVSGVKLLDVDPGADTNRTVYTFVGPPDAVSEAAVQAALRAAALIDMSRHQGAHPRIGALDVCPIVPISGVTMGECVQIARDIGRRLANELQVPVYFYEQAATREARRSLADIRAGEYEGLERKLADPEWAPDCGPAAFNRRSGATVVGAREFLIAYNVNLNTRDKRLAHDIALAVRENGRLKRDAQGRVVTDDAGQALRVPGRLKAVRAIGWYIEQYRQAQVSVNLLDYKKTALHEVFEAVREEAERRGLLVTGSELVGMTPLEPMLQAGRFFFRKQGKSAGMPERELTAMAVRSLGLDQLAPFDADKKVIEYAVRGQSPLMSLSVDRFVDEVSGEVPAPGGGSVAALAGSLAAALAAMVANLTVGKAGYVAASTELSDLAERVQQVKQALAAAVDDDTRAFNEVLEAVRLPRATPEQERARDAAVEQAYQHAAQVPLRTARLSLKAVEAAGQVAVKGIKDAVSDAGVAALMGRAAVESAVLNVLTNLSSIRDVAFVQASREESDRLTADARRLCDEVLAHVRKLVGE
jgi:glutamate formiminotransferase/formiminotetrahydrofolate cyclodeaminase